MKTLLLLFLCAAAALAQTVTLTMDEVPNTPFGTLAVTKGGETFTFSNPLGDTQYNSIGGGTMTYVQAPTICCTPQTVTVTFSAPVYSIQFGASADSNSPVAPILTASFYNGATLLATRTLNSSLVDPFAEGQLSYSSATPITSMVIAPTPSLSGVAYDNLRVTLSPAGSGASVPAGTPLTMAFLAVCMVALGGWVLRGKIADCR